MVFRLFGIHGKVFSRLALAVLVFVQAVPVYAADDYVGRPEVESYIEALVAEHDFSRQALEEIFRQAEKKDKIIELISRPAERRLQWHEYRKILVDQPRVKLGIKFWEENAQTLARAEQVYGVDAAIIVAIIGVETRYGRITGSYRVVDALATLGFDYPPRAKFFLSELTQFLLLAREEGKSPMSLKGSYAGAMGYGQFISSSYRNFAVDFDDDGVRDIWGNEVDAIGSVANYFARHGWQGGGVVTQKVNVEATAEILALANSSLKPNKTLQQWQELGVEIPASMSEDMQTNAMLMRMGQPDGADFWLGFDDFYVITRYNHSRLYAMAVYQLSETIRQLRAEASKAE
jgi:membrane-bound lytic murein transglycosylase B|tara:strand:+ start:3340 stop:4380 length:1041 start_codon:yes stop_codon:yes gene_type:complete